jgi:hypothetical protein
MLVLMGLRRPLLILQGYGGDVGALQITRRSAQDDGAVRQGGIA